MAHDFGQPPNRVGEQYRFIARDAFNYHTGSVAVPSGNVLFTPAGSPILNLPGPRIALRLAEIAGLVADPGATYKIYPYDMSLAIFFYSASTSIKLNYNIFQSTNPPTGFIGQNGVAPLPFYGTWFSEDLMILLNGQPIVSWNISVQADLNNTDTVARSLSANIYAIYEVWQAVLV